jgi:hypothetical protein
MTFSRAIRRAARSGGQSLRKLRNPLFANGAVRALHARSAFSNRRASLA